MSDLVKVITKFTDQQKLFVAIKQTLPNAKITLNWTGEIVVSISANGICRELVFKKDGNSYYVNTEFKNLSRIIHFIDRLSDSYQELWNKL